MRLGRQRWSQFIAFWFNCIFFNLYKQQCIRLTSVWSHKVRENPKIISKFTALLSIRTNWKIFHLTIIVQTHATLVKFTWYWSWNSRSLIRKSNSNWGRSLIFLEQKKNNIEIKNTRKMFSLKLFSTENYSVSSLWELIRNKKKSYS